MMKWINKILLQTNDEDDAQEIRKLLCVQARNRTVPESCNFILMGKADYIGMWAPGGLKRYKEYGIIVDYNPNQKRIELTVQETGDFRVYMDADKFLADWYVYEIGYQDDPNSTVHLTFDEEEEKSPFM